MIKNSNGMIKNKKIFIFIVLAILLILPIITIAASSIEPNPKTAAKQAVAGTTLSTNADLYVFVGTIMKFISSWAGVILIGVIVYSGLLWATAGGDEERVKKSKRMISHAIIGLFISLGGYAISQWIIEAVQFSLNVTQK